MCAPLRSLPALKNSRWVELVKWLVKSIPLNYCLRSQQILLGKLYYIIPRALINVYFNKVDLDKTLFEQQVYHGTTVELNLRLQGG